MKYKPNYFRNLLIQRKLILIIDLDEILLSTIRLESQNIIDESDKYFYFQIVNNNNNIDFYCLKKRPYLDEFLMTMTELFEFHLMSTKSDEYVKKCIEIIDPNNLYFNNKIISVENFHQRNENKALQTNEIFHFNNNLIIPIDVKLSYWNFSSSVIQIKPFQYFSILQNRIETKSIPFNLEIFRKYLIDNDDKDDYLLTVAEVIADIHYEFFLLFEKINFDEHNFQNQLPDVRKIIDRKRDRILNNHIIYCPNKHLNSGLNIDLTCSELIILMGGNESSDFSQDVTEIINGYESDFPIQKALTNVTLEWLVETYYKWKVQDKEKFLCKIINPDQKKSKTINFKVFLTIVKKLSFH